MIKVANLRRTVLALLAVSALSPVFAGIIYVDDDSSGGNGSSWAAAYQSLELAILASTAADELRIAGGTYRQTSTSAFLLGGGRALTWRGGFGGLSNPSNPDLRDLLLFPTVVSGDRNGDDGPEFSQYGDNLSTVVLAVPGGAAAELDGVNVYSAGGEAIRSSGSGGPLRLTHCRVRLNRLRGIVLGISMIADSCEFSDNGAVDIAQATLSSSGSASLFNCQILRCNGGTNVVELQFGGTIEYCTFQKTACHRATEREH